MCERPLFAILPKPLKPGDEVIIKGQFMEDAQGFSVNFTIDQTPNPNDIVFHFKVHFGRNKIIYNTKEGGEYGQEIEIDNDYIGLEENSQAFNLLFHFEDSEIFIYVIEYIDGHESRILIDPPFQINTLIESIKTVQVWDDVSEINEIAFRFS